MIDFSGYPKVTGNLKANKVQVKVTRGIYMTSWSVDKKTTKRNSSLKRLCTTFMSLILCIQLVWCNTLEVKALDVTDSYDITENMGTSEYINFSPTSDYAVLYVAPDVIVESYIGVSNTSGATCEIENHGTIIGPVVVSADVAWVHNAEDSASISTVQAESSNTDLSVYYGSFGSVDVTSISELTLSNCTIQSLSSNTKVTVTGSNVTVTNSLTLSNGTTANINVYETTNITVTNTPITVNCNGSEYTIPAGFDGTIADAFKSVTVTSGNGIELNTEGITGTYWFGDTTGTNTYNVLPGYTFPANYTSGITSTGTGTLNATRVSGQELTISYTLAESEASDVTITLPNATPLDPGTVVFVIPDIYEGQTVSYTFGNDTDYDTSTAVIKYKKSTEDDSTYTTEKPTAIGDYTVLLELPATYDYGAYSQTYSFSIKALEEGLAEISVADISYGETLNPQYSSSTNDTTPTIEYKLQSEDESAYTTTVPTAVGSYDARVTYPATSTHASAVATTTFKINFLPGDGSISVDDVYVGTEINPVYSSEKNGTEHVIIEYKLTTDTEYTTVKPTTVGSYDVRATFPATLIYDEVIATDTFEIKALEAGEGFVNIEDVYVGTDISTTYNSDTNPGTPVIEYKAVSAEDSEYSTSIPTEVGEYMVRATFEKNSTYNTLVVTDTFVIKDLEEGVATVTAEDVIFGLLVSPTFWTSTNQGAKVTILYKEASADDSTYTTTDPSQVGTYTVKAVFEAYGIYKEVVVTDNFTISYLELPDQPYTISGTMGENNIYTSKVEIIPIEGYLISDTLGGNYKESLVYDKTTTGSYVYFKKAATGEMSAGVPLKDFKIDLKAPSINLVNEKVYYGDTLDLSLTDKDISKVVINDETYTKEDLTKVDNKIILDSEGGVTTYTIQIWDMAGNMTEITVVVASEWTKSGIIPVGDIIKLATNKAYTLGEGNWQVEGDSTSYTGNTSFYVSKDGNYKFTQE